MGGSDVDDEALTGLGVVCCVPYYFERMKQ